MRFHFSLILSAMLMLASCASIERPDQLKIKIIETSDVHGAVFPYDFVEDKPSNHSLAQVHSYVKQEREKNDQVVIFLDNGDILQGDPTVYFHNFIKTDEPHILSEVMNFMEYDAATVGNHDIEPGHAVYDKIRAEFNFPWLAANAIETRTGKSYFKPYDIIEKEGVRIAILGMVTPAIPQWLPESIWEGMEFQDMIESAKFWVEEIRKNEKPDVLIGLFHAGYDYSYNNETAETPNNENPSQLIAQQIPGFDVVFVGHDHHGWNKKITNWAGNEVLVLGPTSRARDVAVATIELKLNKKTNHYDKSLSGQIVSMNEYLPDPQFVQKFSTYADDIKNYVAQPLGSLKSTISSQDAFFGDAAFTDLIHRAQLDLTGADISFTAPLSFYKEIEAGALNVGDLFKIYRYENLIYTMKLGGQEIYDYLEFSSAIWFDQMQSENDHMIKFRKDENGEVLISDNGRAKLQNAYYNFDNAEGLIYTVDLRQPKGKRVTIVSLGDGSPFDFNRTYSVAVNSYRGNGGGGHLTAGAKIRQELLADRILQNTNNDFRYHLMAWIKANDVIDPTVNYNWKILPETWVEKSRNQDRELLFGD